MWKPIETAPKNRILIGFIPNFYRAPNTIAAIWWDDKYNMWVAGEWGDDCEPTLWLDFPYPNGITEVNFC